MKTTTTETTAIDAATATPASNTTQSAWKGRMGSVGRFIGMAAAFIALSELYEFGKRRVTASARKAEAEAAEAARAASETRMADKIGRAVGAVVEEKIAQVQSSIGDLAKAQLQTAEELRNAVNDGFGSLARTHQQAVEILVKIHSELATPVKGKSG